MITLPLSISPTSRLIKLPYWLDVTLSRMGSLVDSNQQTQSLRLEQVPLLIVVAGLKAGMKTLGVPSEVGDHVTLQPYVCEGELEEVMGQKIVERLNKNIFVRPTLGHLTSVTFHGETSTISKWISYLTGMNLAATKEVATALEAATGLTGLLPDAGDKFIPEILGKSPKDYDLLDSVLTQPIHYYLIEWSGVDPVMPEEDYVFKPEPEKSPPVALEQTQTTTTADFFTELVGSTTAITETKSDQQTKTDYLEIRDIIARINAAGESHRPIISNPGQKYATLEEVDNHIKRTKDHTTAVANITDRERKLILDYFSFIIGKPYHRALAKVQAQNMDLAIHRIEGHKPTRFMATDLRRIKVVVRDPCPINSGKPSEHGIVVAITGLVTVDR